MKRRLRVTAGLLEGSIFSLDGELSIGRGGECDIQILSRSVSREHAKVRGTGMGRTTIRDLESRNGTFVNDKKVKEEHLRNGDRIRIGDSLLVYEEGESLAVDDDSVTEEFDLKVLSGPALGATVVNTAPSLRNMSISPPEIVMGRPTEPPAMGCGHPLHMEAREKGWKFCPNCAQLA